MTIEQQIEALIAQAPPDGQTPRALKIIAPALRDTAALLGELAYFIRQSPEGNWESTTLAHRDKPNLTKTVIYAYASGEQAELDAAAGLVIVEIPVINLLFQLIALEPVDSLIFFSARPETAPQEVQRQALQRQISQLLSLPPNLA